MKLNSKMVKCTRCRRKLPAKMAVGYWLVVTYVTPWLRRIKQRMYCTNCQHNDGYGLGL